jgi:DNA (cytosine-5)-methyltransferase 1
MNYYNENNPHAAAWLRELIQANLIAPGIVDERSIVNVPSEELAQYNQCHLFAGIGGWSYALRLAGWPDDAPVWTGSCPCQPFSAAGQRKVDSDERNLWPAFRTHITQRKPAAVFGEQVASKDGRIWLAGVRTDLETLGYGVGAADLCAAGISAPHIRQRLYWLAHTHSRRWFPRDSKTRSSSATVQPGLTSEGNGGLAYAESSERRSPSEGRNDVSDGQDSGRQEAASGHRISGPPHPRLVDAHRYHEHWWSGTLQVGRNCLEGEVERGGRKYRAQWRVKPGLSMLADGIPGRVAQLCGFGNAIVPQLAAEFIQASVEAIRKIMEQTL